MEEYNHQEYLEVMEEGIIAACQLIIINLIFQEYEEAIERFSALKGLMGSITHDEMVMMVNKQGVASRESGWIAKGWCEANGIKNTIIEFETAGVRASCGETFHYRKNKKTWGDLVSIENDTTACVNADPAIHGEDITRLHFWLKTNNPILIKQMTRNELKIVMGSALVNAAMRGKKGDFLKVVTPTEAIRIERLTGLSLDIIWSSIRKGNKALVEHLGTRYSPKREQMRRSGMFVADCPHPQDDLFAEGVEFRRRDKRSFTPSQECVDNSISQLDLFAA